jgi:hypothetical protein
MIGLGNLLQAVAHLFGCFVGIGGGAIVQIQCATAEGGQASNAIAGGAQQNSAARSASASCTLAEQPGNKATAP